MAHFMVVERFKNGDAVPVYKRLRDKGRMAPVGLEYVASWITDDLAVCFQVMKGERTKVDLWIAQWQDLIDFEVLPALTSAEAQTRLSPKL